MYMFNSKDDWVTGIYSITLLLIMYDTYSKRLYAFVKHIFHMIFKTNHKNR